MAIPMALPHARQLPPSSISSSHLLPVSLIPGESVDAINVPLTQPDDRPFTRPIRCRCFSHSSTHMQSCLLHLASCCVAGSPNHGAHPTKDAETYATSTLSSADVTPLRMTTIYSPHELGSKHVNECIGGSALVVVQIKSLRRLGRDSLLHVRHATYGYGHNI
jgi:hypothetical protein